MASGSAGEGAGSNTDKKTSKVVIITAPVFATSPRVTRGRADEPRALAGKRVARAVSPSPKQGAKPGR